MMLIMSCFVDYVVSGTVQFILVVLQYFSINFSFILVWVLVRNNSVISFPCLCFHFLQWRTAVEA